MAGVLGSVPSSGTAKVAPDLLRDRCYWDGVWRASSERRNVLNPSSGEIVGSVPCVSARDVEEAVASAHRAFLSWRAMLPRTRADVLLAWRDLMLKRQEDLAVLMTLEQGKPLAEARGEIAYGAEFVRWFAEEGGRLYGDVTPPHLPNRKMFVQREPIGVAALVTPWNFPSAMITRKAAAALAAGCTVVAAPSMETPLSALALAALAEEAGFPPGVFSVLTGAPETIVGTLCALPKVRALSFTGSTEIGRKLMAQCAPSVKRVSLELGGHAPFIVFADADIELAAREAVAAKFTTGGQDCLAANRIYVQAPAHDAFRAAFVRAAAKLRVGDGMQADTDIGPLTNIAAVKKCSAQVRDALAKGARIELGGDPEIEGLFFPPTILSDVTPDMEIMCSETFGPVAAICAFEDEASVVAAANDTEYGLVAYVFTKDLSRAHRVSDALEFGMVAVNTAQITGAPIPFGGVKQSGLGREGSRYGVDEFTELKYICMAV